MKAEFLVGISLSSGIIDDQRFESGSPRPPNLSLLIVPMLALPCPGQLIFFHLNMDGELTTLAISAGLFAVALASDDLLNAAQCRANPKCLGS